MSETVHYKGVLHKVERLEGESIEQQCKRLLGGKEKPSYFKDYREYLLDQNYREYVVDKGVLYKVEAEELDSDESMFEAGFNENGEISFNVRYYNGGCGFDEAIETALENLEEKSNTIKPILCPNCQKDIISSHATVDSEVKGFINTLYECEECNISLYVNKVEHTAYELSPELKEMMIKNQLKWVNEGCEWSKGFVEGVEFLLKQQNKYRYGLY